MTADRDDDKRLEALKRGDTGAWDDFFKEHDALIRSVIGWPKWRLRPHDQEDVAQIVRKELVKSISRFRADSSIEHFVKRVCIHRIIDEIRRQVRKDRPIVAFRTRTEDGEEYEMDTQAPKELEPVEQVIAFERAQALSALLDEIDERCRSSIRDYYFEDLSYKEIAAKRDISINTVGSRLSKCLDRLRRLAQGTSDFGED